MTYSPEKRDSMPIPVEPAHLDAYLKVTSAETNRIVYIPWKGPVKLVYAYVVTETAEGNTAAVEIDLELNAAGGTEIMTITVAQNAAVGDVDEATYTSESAAKGLSRDNTSKDAINIEVGANAGAAWTGTLRMYFEKQV